MPLLNHSVVDKVLHIELDDPEARNAFSPAMAEEFDLALKSHQFSAVVVTAKGPSFCSGGNLKYYAKLKNKDQGLEANERITQILDNFHKLNVPKACFINGTVFGGGIELVSCFDFVCSSPSSLFGLWQRRIGLTFGWGAESRLLCRLSQRDLKRWLLSADTISAYQANRLGLVDKVSLSNQGKKDCLQWLKASLDLGDEGLKAILDHDGESEKAFKKLWMTEKHKAMLKRFN